MTWRIGLRMGGQVLRLDPAAPDRIFADRLGVGAHEELELVEKDGAFFATFLAARRALAITNNGTVETRAAGTDGPWEQFRVAKMPGDGVIVLYRVYEGTDRVLLFLQVELL